MKVKDSNPRNSKQAIIFGLIVDDLLNYKLVTALLKLNLTSKQYYAKFDSYIFQFLGFNVLKNEAVFNYYKRRRADVERISLEKGNDELHDLAWDILCELERRKKICRLKKEL